MNDGAAIPGLRIDPSPGCARVGPNAVTRIAESLLERQGEAMTRTIFAEAGIAGWLAAPPDAMVPEADVAALHRAMREVLGEAEGRAVAAGAGRRTAAYLLANRIPPAVQWLLRLLPARPSARLLLRAIGRHAWTFVGSGSFHAGHGDGVTISIAGGPLRAAGPAAASVAAYYAATFEALFIALVHPRTRLVAVTRATEASGASTFRLVW